MILYERTKQSIRQYHKDVCARKYIYHTNFQLVQFQGNSVLVTTITKGHIQITEKIIQEHQQTPEAMLINKIGNISQLIEKGYFNGCVDISLKSTYYSGHVYFTDNINKTII